MRKMLAIQKTGEAISDRCRRGLQMEISLVEVIGPQKDQCDWSVLGKGIRWGKNSMRETGRSSVRPQWTEQEVPRVSQQLGVFPTVQGQSFVFANSAVVIGDGNKKAALKFHCYWLWSQTGFSLFTFLEHLYGA